MRSQDGPVLVVDDDPDIREALTQILEDRGFDVITAANGQEALTLLRSLRVPPAVILLDLMMPIMDGYGFLEAYRNDASLAVIPIAIITAGHGIDLSRIDSAPIVPKPINVHRLFSIIDEMGAAAEVVP
jgi:CheY-like chemotaxis protein